MLRRIALALIIGFTSHAAAQVTGAFSPAHPKLKELVIVSNDIVRIGDLVENAGTSASIPVFRSPDVGYTGGVPLARVIEALAPYKLASLDTGGITEVVVTRLSRAISAKDIETGIARMLAGQYGFSDAKSISITFDREVRTIHVEHSATDDLQVTRLNVDPRTGRFFAALDIPGSAIARRVGLRYSGIAVETAEVTVLTRTLNRGEIVKSTDVATERKPKADAVGETISADMAVGLATKRALRAGSPLRPGDLSRPEVIQRNEVVTIVYDVPGLLLTVRGKALEAGGLGDLVNILNVQSNRTVQATVIGPGRVSIGANSVATTASVPSNTVRQNAE